MKFRTIAVQVPNEIKQIPNDFFLLGWFADCRQLGHPFTEWLNFMLKYVNIYLKEWSFVTFESVVCNKRKNSSLATYESAVYNTRIISLSSLELVA